MTVREVPATCPRCGSPRVVRVMWNFKRLSTDDQADIQHGKIILGSRARRVGGSRLIEQRDVPSWVCLLCEPRWSEVHHLSMQDYELQIAKEDAVAARQFEVALPIRNSQDEVLMRLETLINELLTK